MFNYNVANHTPSISNNYWLEFEAGSSGDNESVPLKKWATENSCMVTSIGQPEISTSAVTISRGPYKLKVPGKPEYGEFTVSFYCDSNYELMKDLFLWQAKLYSIPEHPNGVHTVGKKKKNDYFNNIHVYKVDSDGSKKADTNSPHWILKDAWPSSVSYGSLSYNSSETLKLEVTFVASKIEYTEVGTNDGK